MKKSFSIYPNNWY